MLIGLPLLGVALAGRPLAPYLEFPPLTRYVVHAPFSWAVFSALTLFVLACIAPFALRVWRSAAPVAPRAGPALPWWGWAGAVLLGAAWVVAWNRFAWAQAIQAYTFTPIWLGYIVVINALAYKYTLLSCAKACYLSSNDASARQIIYVGDEPYENHAEYRRRTSCQGPAR